MDISKDHLHILEDVVMVQSNGRVHLEISMQRKETIGM